MSLYGGRIYIMQRSRHEVAGCSLHEQVCYLILSTAPAH